MEIESIFEAQEAWSPIRAHVRHFDLCVQQTNRPLAYHGLLHGGLFSREASLPVYIYVTEGTSARIVLIRIHCKCRHILSDKAIKCLKIRFYSCILFQCLVQFGITLDLP